ncbi:MAG: hypothetical protein B7Y39_12965 [Bdellovibrio sp. 28-41-41]|nr:MAG: hypothetical protein B7Y39_12965 [Bdellovibrio sp. 28-41-41]
MSLTSKKPRPLNRSSASRDAKLFVIATEGEITEPQYFKLFRSTRIQIKILKTEKGHSAPKKVLERLSAYKEDYQLDKNDRLFLVIDTDRWPAKTLAQVAKSCHEQNIILAASNPCFEIWIALHFFEAANVEKTSKDIQQQLQNHLGGYNKIIKPHWFSIKNITEAYEKAKILDAGSKDRWPQSSGTRVYRIIEELKESLNITT